VGGNTMRGHDLKDLQEIISISLSRLFHVTIKK